MRNPHAVPRTTRGNVARMPTHIARPSDDQVPDFHRGYFAAIAHERDAVPVLDAQLTLMRALATLPDGVADHRYAPGKWSVREVVGHLADGERVVAYRLLCLARGEAGPLPRFDEQAYAAQSNAGRRSMASLAEELALVRQATLALVRSLDEADLDRRGRVGDWTLTPRVLAFVIAGHVQHHVNVLRERYGVPL
jgi:uncharacterized damage-inducible protein DinB